MSKMRQPGWLERTDVDILTVGVIGLTVRRRRALTHNGGSWEHAGMSGDDGLLLGCCTTSMRECRRYVAQAAACLVVEPTAAADW